MKIIQSVILGSIAVCLSVAVLSCNVSLPYHPTQFVPPALQIALQSPDSIKAFLGTNNTNFKFAFTSKNDFNLYVVDFSQTVTAQDGTKHPKAFVLKKDAAHSGSMPDSPIFSSDGKLVTYYLRNGVTPVGAYVQIAEENSTPVLIALNGTDPHFWSDSNNLYVVYSNRAIVKGIAELDTSNGGLTYRQQIDKVSGAKIGSPEVIAKVACTGGLSQNGQYLCTGYQVGAFYDINARQLFPVNWENQTNYLQICNPSISPDSAYPDWMLFLQLGGVQFLQYAAGIEPLGSIGDHEYLIMANKNNIVEWYIKLPANHYEWQDPEWTNQFNFVVAIAKISNRDEDNQFDCMLIKRSGTDNAMLNLTNGTFKLDNTATPFFWIGN